MRHRTPHHDRGGPRNLAGLMAGVAFGTMSLALLFLGMRAVMAIGGACADGGPYVSARACPDGVPLAMVGGIFGMFGSVGLVVGFGGGVRPGMAGLAFLGWPALFLSLGWNFLEFGLNPPGGGLAWGWLICAVTFAAMGGGPLLFAARSLPPGAWRRLIGRIPALVALAALLGVTLGTTLFGAISG